MAENNDIPPWEPESPGYSGWVYFSTYVVGIVVGFIGSLIGLMMLFGGLGLFERGRGAWMTVICSIVLAGAAAAIVKVFRSRIRNRRPFALGFLTGVCLLALLVGVCSFVSGPLIPG